jgi:iron complex outermembrane receptor protein
MDCRTYCRVWTFWVCLLATALMRATFAAEPDATPVEFHIAGGDATTTLTEFSRQARLQLLFDYNVVKGHTTKPLDGLFPPAEALEQLLANTDLDFDFVNERTLAVMRKKVAPDTAKTPAAETKPAKRASRPPKNNRSDGDPQAGAEEVIRITGTYMRDRPPVGEEIISFSREDIDLTGAANPADFLRTLPQAFGGGPNQDTHIGPEALSNSGLGVGVNLRGLGARATLVLINGRRVAPSGTEGEFVDIENIPLSAVERIDILPDSASAIYGADAVGGVVNFVLRDKFDGAETILRGGSGIRGDLQEYLVSQTLGKTWDGGHGLIAFEYYDRGALPAADRAYATSDLQPFGGGDYNTILTNPGNIIDPLTRQTWAIPSGQNGTHLTAAELTAGTQNLQSLFRDREIIPKQERWTLYGSGRQEFGERFSLFTDFLLGHRRASEEFGGLGAEFVVPNTNPFYVNPSGTAAPVVAAYNFADDLGPLTEHAGIDTLNATVGLDFDAGAAWSVSTYASYVREKQNQLESGEINPNALALALADPNPLTAFNPFGDGSNTNAATLATLGTDYSLWLDSQVKTVDLTADGPVGKIAGVPLKLAVGSAWREEIYSTTVITPGIGGSAGNDHNADRNIVSAFAQLVAPVVSQQDAIAGINTLVFSAAGRYENYTSYGGSTTPKYSMVWSPLRGISFRGTWSRSVRPPSLVDLDASHNGAAILAVPDAAVPGGMTTALFWSGGNANVGPERAQSWTAGLDLTPDIAPGLTVGLTYFRTRFKDRIQATPYSPSILTDPAYSTVVTQNPSAARISYVCNHGVYTQGTVAQCASTPVGMLVDLRVRNLGALLTDGIDFNTNYQVPTPLGQLKFGLNGTYLRDFSEAQTPDQPLTSLLNTQNEPINLRLRASTGWGYHEWSTLLAANFTNSYRDTASIPQRRVDSWTTIDLQLRYDFSDDASSWLRGMSVELNARNLFNVDPPFLNNQVTYIGYDQENADPYGRLLSLQLRKRW